MDTIERNYVEFTDGIVTDEIDAGDLDLDSMFPLKDSGLPSSLFQNNSARRVYIAAAVSKHPSVFQVFGCGRTGDGRYFRVARITLNVDVTRKHLAEAMQEIDGKIGDEFTSHLELK